MASETERDLQELYLAGRTRQQAMNALNIRNTNVMAGLSFRLKLHWSWPLENRISGIEPDTTTKTRASGGSPRPAQVPSAVAPALPQSVTTAAAPKKTASNPPQPTETVKTRPRLKPTGAVSSRDKRLRGYADNEPNPMFPADLSREDRKFFERLYVG